MEATEYTSIDGEKVEIINIIESVSRYNINDTIAVVEKSYEIEYKPVSRNAAWTYKEYTHSKYFYIVESQENVADYSVTATFRYDGESLAEYRDKKIGFSGEEPILYSR